MANSSGSRSSSLGPEVTTLVAAVSAGIAAGALVATSILSKRRGSNFSSCSLLSWIVAPKSGLPERLSADVPAHRQWMQRMQAFIFDIDGVVHVAGKPVVGAPEALNALRAAGKRVLFMTNNATKTPEKIVEEFASFGASAVPAEVMTSSIAAASFLETKNLRGSKVYVVGMDSLALELQRSAGVQTFGAQADFSKTREEVQSEFGAVMDPPVESVKAVVVGADYWISYYKLCRAANYLWQNPACLFVATNPDPRAKVGERGIGCAAGSLVAAVATASGRQPDIVCGKPSAGLAKHLLESQGLDPATTCMVGDRTDTDIEFGLSAGMQTLFVESGTMTLEEAITATQPSGRPQFVASSIATLGALVAAGQRQGSAGC